VERAFQLARSGRFARVLDIKAQLVREGYYAYQIIGPTLRKQLAQEMQAARQRSPDDGPR
jgi:hypothetical protein